MPLLPPQLHSKRIRMMIQHIFPPQKLLLHIRNTSQMIDGFAVHSMIFHMQKKVPALAVSRSIPG